MISTSLLLSGLGIIALLFGILVTLLIWNKPVLVIYIQIAYCCFMRLLITQFKFPVFIKYLSDYLTIILLVQIILGFSKAKTLNIRKPFIFIILFAVAAIVSTMYNNSGFIFFVWGARSYFRFFIFFLACTIFLKQENIDKMIKYLFILLPINTVMALFQYFILGLRDDFVGGLFGIVKGCNAEMYLYLSVVTLITIVFYVNYKISILRFLFNVLMVVLIAAISELKIVFFVLPIIVLIIFIMSFPNRRAFLMVNISIALVAVSLLFFLLLYPDWLKDFENFNMLLDHTVMDKYAGEGSLGRLTAGPFLIRNILSGTSNKLFGVGFGNASTFLHFISEFYNRYEVLSYDLFSYSLLLFEVGLIGLITYCLFFVAVLFESIRIKMKIGKKHAAYSTVSFIASTMVFQLLIYNQSMYMDCAFIIFFALSFPFILEKDTYEERIPAESGILAEANRGI